MSSAAPPPEPDYSGQTIGEFTVLRKIGQGGMGQVYLAHQQSLKRDVALKILKADLAENATALRRFRAEAEAVARITHANIVQVYSVGEQNGLHYMALEFVEGRNLRDYIARKGPPELPVAIAIIRQIAAALQRANELGLVHRDIKPENILVTRKAEVKVADFGLSRFFAGDTPAINLTQSGVTLGTPLYMSPEQVRGEPTDHRSDLYSFGVTCYHLLSGEPPFKGRTAFEVTIQHVQNEPVPLAALRPDLPADLCAMVHKLMAKRVEDRYQSARDVIRDLGKIREGLPLGLNVTNAAPAAPYFAGMTAVGGPTASAVASTVFLGPPKASRPGAGLAYALAAVVLAGAGFAVAYTWPRGGNAKPGIVAAERSVERIVSTRELDLKAKIDNRATTGEDLLTAMIDLGLLYVQERRWADAEALFKDLESERNPRISRPQEQVHILAGKLGRAIVLARQDRAKESTALFLEALTRTRAGVELPKGSARNLPAAAFAQGFFLRHPDLSQAVAEAIARNAENGSREPKLDWLRSPGSLVTGPKG